MSILTTSVSGSADLCDAMHTNIVPWTFSVGLPQVVVSSTSGSVRPMAATGANGSRRFATGRVYADRGDQGATASTISSGSSSRIQWPLPVAIRWRPTGTRRPDAACAATRMRLVRAGDDDDRDVGRRNRGRDRRGFGLQHAEIVGHGVEALRLAPVRLDRRVQLRRQLAHFADQALEGPGRPRAEQLDERSRRAGVAAGEQGEGRPHHADARQDRADGRRLAGAPQQPRLGRRPVEPFDRRIDQHEAGDLLRVPRGIAANDEAAEGMADEDDARAGAERGPWAGAERSDDGTEVVEDARERPREDAASLQARPARS